MTATETLIKKLVTRPWGIAVTGLTLYFWRIVEILWNFGLEKPFSAQSLMLGVVQMKAWLVKLEEVCVSLKFTVRV